MGWVCSNQTSGSLSLSLLESRSLVYLSFCERPQAKQVPGGKHEEDFNIALEVSEPESNGTISLIEIAASCKWTWLRHVGSAMRHC